MDSKDLQKTARMLLLMFFAISAAVAWIAVIDKPTKGNIEKAVRRSFPLL